jgi:superfamily II DNA or RNA helicase
MSRIEIIKRSHSFQVKTNYRGLASIIARFAERFEEMEWKRVKGQPATFQLIKSYHVVNATGNDFSFHINSFKEFIGYLHWSGIDESFYTIETMKMHRPERIDIKIVSPYKPMEEQVPLIKYLGEPGKTKILTLQTGKGKTYCFLQGFAEIKERCSLILPAKYIQRWVDDLTGPGQVVNLEEKDLWVVKGAPDFARIIAAAKNGEMNAKMIIFSSTTFQLYLKAFREDPVAALKEYGCEPIKLMKLLKVGVLGRDEVHELFHFNFLVDLSINVPKTISLSATVDFDNKMTNKMCSLMFPKSEQINNGEWDKYIKAVGLFWKLEKPQLVRCTLNGAYNHGAFETSIIKNKRLLANYLDMVQDMVESIYSRFDNNEKIIVFAYTVQMCTLIAKRMEEVYSDDKEIVINRYVGEDDYGDLMTGNVIVSTLKSAGTAVDIPMLRAVLMTTAIYSTQSNVQALGRLRKLKHRKDVSPEFYYLICKDIEKHIDYHKAKVKQFDGKVLSHETKITQYLV